MSYLPVDTTVYILDKCLRQLVKQPISSLFAAKSVQEKFSKCYSL